MPINLDGPSIIDLGGTIINSDGTITSHIIDFEPVRHGHWEVWFENEETRQVKCSECRMMFTVGKGRDGNYCPNCGAKMDEVGEDGGVD